MTSGGASTLTYDLNGNMTGDGTNSYSWDCENRMIQITYPGSGNNSQFVYDGLGRNVSILEYSGGSLTNTKIVCWASSERCEIRNATGTITAQFFPLGETISGTNYFWDRTKDGSIREMTNSSGAIVDQLGYDPYGQPTTLQGSIASDFQYAGYYFHSASGLNLTRTRAYSSKFGRFINRDPIAESGGVNVYGYVANEPIGYRDPSGTVIGGWGGNGKGSCGTGHHNNGPGNNGGGNGPRNGSNSGGFPFGPGGAGGPGPWNGGDPGGGWWGGGGWGGWFGGGPSFNNGGSNGGQNGGGNGGQNGGTNGGQNGNNGGGSGPDLPPGSPGGPMGPPTPPPGWPGGPAGPPPPDNLPPGWGFPPGEFEPPDKHWPWGDYEPGGQGNFGPPTGPGSLPPGGPIQP